MLKYVFIVALFVVGCAFHKRADVNYDVAKVNTGMILSLEFPADFASRECTLLIRGQEHRYELSFSDIKSYPAFISMEPDTYSFEKIDCTLIDSFVEREYLIGADFLRNLAVSRNSVSVVLPLVIKQSGNEQLSILQDRNFQKKAVSKIHSVLRENEAIISAHNRSGINRNFFKDGSRAPSVQALMTKAGADIHQYSNAAMSCYEQEITTNILPLGRESIRWARNSQNVNVESSNSKKRLNNYSQIYIGCIEDVVRSAQNDQKIHSIAIDF